jgi:hypothetical protein
MNQFIEKPGDDTGIQTNVWGPAGWLFLHSIAQNYPWKPTEDQKKWYMSFFKSIGNVLPCRYCRESYIKFINEPDTNLNVSVMESRKLLVHWLYNVHEKVNKKLNKRGATLKSVWNRYESFRSKCTKSPEKVVKKGCFDPMKGHRKRCIIKVVSFGKKGKIKLLSIKKSNNKSKKLMATFEINGRKKVIHFGANGMSDYTKHRDKERKKRYQIRHHKDLKTNDPTRAGYLSMFILWNKPSLHASITDYRRRLNIFNNTSRFPIN